MMFARPLLRLRSCLDGRESGRAGQKGAMPETSCGKSSLRGNEGGGTNKGGRKAPALQAFYFIISITIPYLFLIITLLDIFFC